MSVRWAHCDCECAGGPALFLRHQLEAPDRGQLQPVLQSLHGELSAALWWHHRSVGVSYRYRFISTLSSSSSSSSSSFIASSSSSSSLSVRVSVFYVENGRRHTSLLSCVSSPAICSSVSSSSFIASSSSSSSSSASFSSSFLSVRVSVFYVENGRRTTSLLSSVSSPAICSSVF